MKRQLLFLMCAMILCLTGTGRAQSDWTQPYASDEYTVGLWHLDETSGTVVDDASANDLFGEIIGTPDWGSGQSGFNGALHCGGTNFPSITDDAVLSGMEKLTIECWFKIDSYGADFWNYLFEKEGSYTLYVVDSDETHRDKLWAKFTTNTGEYIVMPDYQVPLDTWTHVAVEYTGEMVTMYINGQPADSIAASGTIVSSSTPLLLGARNVSNPMHGWMDEVRISDYARYARFQTPQLIAHWTFDEIVNDTIEDVTGNGFDGMVIGAYEDGGLYDGALRFDGDDDRVEIDNPIVNTPPYTIAAWVKVEPGTDDHYFVASNGGPTAGYHGMSLTLYNRHTWSFYACGSSAGNSWGASAPNPEDDWVFLCGTWDGTPDGSEVKLFINGQLASTGTSHTAGGPSVADFMIGGSAVHDDIDNFRGLIDDLRLYNYVLTPAEIQNLYLNDAVSIQALAIDIECDSTFMVPVYGQFTKDVCALSPSLHWTANYDLTLQDIDYSGTGLETWSQADSVNNETDQVIFGGLNFEGTPIAAETTMLLANLIFTIPDGFAYGDTILLTFEATELGPHSNEFADCETSGLMDVRYDFDTVSVFTSKLGRYVAGDANGDGTFNIGDAVYMVNYIFNGGPAPVNLDAGDANGDCSLNIGDPVYMINYIFKGGPPPQCGCVTGDYCCISDFEEAGFYKTGHPGWGPEITVEYDGEVSTISVESTRDIYGLQLRVRTQADARITNQVNGIDVFASRFANETLIGLLDMKGEGYIPPGEISLIQIEGPAEVIDAIAADVSGMTSESGIRNNFNTLIRRFESSSYPNPFNPTTTISYALPDAADVTIDVFNVAGQKVRTLASGYKEAGEYSVVWDSKDTMGQTVASGIYFYRIIAGKYSDTKKMILLK
ncbi:MAG: LamG-like jellyroll fold domain-containing protein [Candidatus Zixiibacteriota bacterium]